MKARAVVSGILALGVVLLLSACTGPGGPETLSWAKNQPRVLSAKLHYDPDFEAIPAVIATVAPSASDAQLIDLAAKARKFLREKGSDTIDLTLALPNAALDVNKDDPRWVSKEWVAVHDDPRILDGHVSSDTLTVRTTRSDVIPVFKTYMSYAPNVPISVFSAPGGRYGLHLADGYQCKPTAADLAYASEVLADIQVAGGRLDPCGDSIIVAGKPTDLVDLASALHAGESENAVVVADSDAENVFQTPAYSLALDAALPKALALIRPLIASGEFSSVVLGDDASLSLVGHLPQTAQLVYSTTDWGTVSPITIRDKKVTIGITGKSGFETNYKLARKLEAIGTSTHVLVTPDRIQVDMRLGDDGSVDDYAKYGKQELAAIAGSGMWRGRLVVVETEDHDGVEFANGIATDVNDNHPSNPRFIAYWNSLTG